MRIFRRAAFVNDSGTTNNQSLDGLSRPRSRSGSVDAALGRVKNVLPDRSEKEQQRIHEMKSNVAARLNGDNIASEGASNANDHIKKSFSKCEGVIGALQNAWPQAAAYAMTRCGVDPEKIEDPKHADAIVKAIGKAPTEHAKLFGLFHGSEAVRRAFDGDPLVQDAVDRHQSTDGFLIGSKNFGL